MKIACGTDIIEIDRIKQSIEDMGERFLERVYTEKEIEYCESKKGQKYQHYAARFAAKEAAFKAISEQLNDKYSMEELKTAFRNQANKWHPDHNLSNREFAENKMKQINSAYEMLKNDGYNVKSVLEENLAVAACVVR